MIRPLDGREPRIHGDVFIAESAEIIGDVSLDEQSSVWYNAVLRADINHIRIGSRTNVQDGCVLHVQQTLPLLIGSNVTVGHAAILHACTIEDYCLIGMGAIVLDNARLKPYTLVAAGTIVLNNADFSGGVLIAGVPGKVVRQLRADEKRLLEESAQTYVGIAHKHRLPS